MDKKMLNKIIDDMKSVVERSKDEIFHISEETMKEHNALQKELEETKGLVKEYIEREKQLDIAVRQSRKKLSLVSKQFNRYSEKEIRTIYEATHRLQTELLIIRREEQSLRQKRDELERRLVRLMITVEHANNLGRKVSVISTYLDNDFNYLNEALRSAQQKQQLGLKVIEAQELERKRLSREIHDGPAQMLANILLRSEIVDMSIKKGNFEQALVEVSSIRENIRTSLQEVRRIIYDLRPMALDDLGLFPTIRKHISTMAEFHNLEINLVLLGNEERLNSNYEVAIFRLVQEALQNAINHANATLIKVAIEVRKDNINVIIKDNGIGFDVSQKKKNTFGLIGMEERVEMLEGRLTITSEVNEGTNIMIVIPYNNDKI